MVYKVNAFYKNETAEHNKLSSFILAAAAFDSTKIIISGTPDKKSLEVYIDIPDQAIEHFNPADYGVELTKPKIRRGFKITRYYKRYIFQSMKPTQPQNVLTQNVRIITEIEASRLFDIPYSTFLNDGLLVFDISSNLKADIIRENIDVSADYYKCNPPKYEIRISSNDNNLITSVLTKEVYTLDQPKDPNKTSTSRHEDYYSADEIRNLLHSFTKYCSGFVAINTHATHQTTPYELLDPRYRNDSGRKREKIGFYRNENEPIYLPYGAGENSVIIGISGSHKTTLLENLAREGLDNNMAIIAISPLKNDFRDLYVKHKGPKYLFSAVSDPTHPLFMNPFLPPLGVSASVWQSTLHKIMTLISSIGSPDSILPLIFAESAASMYAAAPRSEWNLITFAKYTNRQLKRSTYAKELNANISQAVRKRLFQIANAPCLFSTVSNVDFEKILEPGTLTVVELDNLENVELLTVAGVFLYTLIFAVKNRTNRKARVNLLVDELHKIVGTPDTTGQTTSAVRTQLLDSLFEMRGYGMNSIFADQRASMVGLQTILDGCPNRIWLRSERNEISERCIGAAADPAILDAEKGQGIYYHAGYYDPVYFSMYDYNYRTDPDSIAKANQILEKEAASKDIAKPFNFCKNCKATPQKCLKCREIGRTLFDQGWGISTKVSSDDKKTMRQFTGPEHICNYYHVLNGSSAADAPKPAVAKTNADRKNKKKG